MRRPRKYNSDYMSRKMDERLEQVEDNLSALYANAAFDMNAKFSDFIKEHEKRDENYRAKVEAGEMSEEEYISWRNREIVRDTRFRSTIDSLSDMMVNTDIAAMALLEGEMPLVVAQSYNFVQSLGFKAAEEAGLSQGTFQIYNARSVQTIIDKNPDLLKPKVDVSEDKKWSMDKINKEITQSIVQGEAIPKVADRISRVAHMSESAAVRNARTAMTSAENLGRSEAAQDLKEKGIPIEEQWSATMDSRTRESHLLLDGTYKDENGYFGADFLNTPLRYPADPLGDPEEIYNCRCRLSIRLQGVDHSQDGGLYEKFMQEKHPEDWKNIQENEGMQARKAEAEATRERQKTLKEELAAKQEEERQKAQEQPTVAEDKPPVIDAETAIASTEPTRTAIEESSSFVPAKTIAEAEDYAESHYVEGGLGRFTNAGKDVSFRGIDVEVANAINHRLTTIYENFGIQPITTLEAYGKRDKRIFAKDGEALMCTSPFGNIGINSTFLSSMQTIGSYTEEGRKAFDYVVENIESLSGRQRAFAEACKTAGRQVVDDSVEGYITHEIGHLLSFGDSNSALGDISKNTEWEGYAAQLSGYATTSFSEYVAESFVAYFNGEADKMQPEMVSLFDSLRRKDNG